ncbi:MAG TPA: radical SAM protein [Deltaproteobacteria bacterium]|nr:radical SAM protein [Deltaproteobacteria bacterium]
MEDPQTARTTRVDQRVRITEIYPSIQGESTHVGKPCVFVRLTGCNLRCSWCDSGFTFTGGGWVPLVDVVQQAHGFGIHTVEITGGEPLLQPAAIPLMQRLLELGHEVLLETSGSLSIAAVPEAVHVILDLKPPASGEVARNLWSNVALLKPHHEVKIVLADRGDYEWARRIVAEHALPARCPVLLSPAHGLGDPAEIVSWILEDRLDVRLQLQLHKVIWDPDARAR